MREALMHPGTGYYQQREIFGRAGDFITSPDISQLFGEAAGCPLAVQLVELGPGRGTLMDDVLRTLAQFPNFARALTAVQLIEQGEVLKRVQLNTLADASSSDAPRLKRVPHATLAWHDTVAACFAHAPTPPTPAPWTLWLAHEFFDALPIHRFQLTEQGWREVMVDVDDSATSPYRFCFVVAPAHTLASRTLVSALSPDVAERPHSLGLSLGDTIEVSPMSVDTVHAISRHISAPTGAGGAALLVDYGSTRLASNSLRGIQSHAFVHPLSRPGHVDLSVDVNFRWLAGAAERAQGIQQRLAMLLRATSASRHSDLIRGYQRLVDTSVNGMGKVYHALAITRTPQPPVGFA